MLALGGCNQGSKPSSAESLLSGGSSSGDSELKGKILFVKKGNLWVWDNGNLKQLTKGGGDMHPSWSPDGTAIAYVNKSDSYSDLMIMSAVSGDYKQVTKNKSASILENVWAFRPTWSPGGQKLTYLSDVQSDNLALWEIGADGNNRRRITFLGVNFGGIESPSYSPDGKNIAVTAYREQIPQIWLFTIANGKWTQITKEKAGAYDSRFSPGGSKIAYAARQAGDHDVKVINPDGTNVIEITTDGKSRAPTWSADGKYLAFVSGRSGTFEIWAVKVQTSSTGEFQVGEPRQLTKGQDIDPGAGLSWRP